MKSLEEIYREMCDEFRKQTGCEADGTGDLAVRMYASAAQVHALYVQEDWLARQCFPQTAGGEYLDLHAQLRGLTRREAARAVGAIRFEMDHPAAGDLPIPAGSVCMTAGLVRFETEEAAVLPAGQTSVTVRARAVEPGSGGNVPAGTIRIMAVAPVGVSRCVNESPFVGGADRETDEALRERVLETFRRMPNGANTAFYEQGAMSFEEVAAAVVQPRKRGVGTVDVVVAVREGLPESGLLEKLRAYFQERREIAVDVSVRAPAVKSVDVAVAVKPSEGVTAQAAEQAARSAVEAWFSGERLGKSVLRAELSGLVFGAPGVANCSITAPASDIAVAEDELPRLGRLTVSAMA